MTLTPREIQIIQMIANGYTDREIAKKLSLSVNTTNTHRKNILRKVGVKNTALLIRFAIENKLVQ